MTHEDGLVGFFLFRPPYAELEAVQRPDRLPRSMGTSGAALVWCMASPDRNQEIQAARGRCPGLSLIAILPPADTVTRRDQIFRMIELCRPVSVMPYHEEPHRDDLHALLSAPPADLAAAAVDFIRWRGITLDLEIRRLVRRTLELSADLRSVNALARGVYLSRRALGRRFTTCGLPVPSHWLHMGRVLRAVIRLQEPGSTLAQVAYGLGYPDAFSLSNQLKRLTGVRPSEARTRRGWEWLLESWVQKEVATGGFSEAHVRRIARTANAQATTSPQSRVARAESSPTRDPAATPVEALPDAL